MFCDTCHSPTLGLPCKCGSRQFASVEIPDPSSIPKTKPKDPPQQPKEILLKKRWQFWK